jgi:hypothetical protein
MIDFWHRFGLLVFIIGVAGLWGNYSLEGIRWIYTLMLAIGGLLNLMPDDYFGTKKTIKRDKDEN